MSNRNKEKSHVEKIISGVSLGFVFIVFGLFLYFNSTFFYFELLTTLISLFAFLIGIAGISLEVSKINDETLGFSDFGTGLFIFIIWAILFYYFSTVWVNVLTLPLLLLGLYGIFNGISQLIYALIIKGESRGKIILKLIMSILQLIGFTSAIITISNAFK